MPRKVIDISVPLENDVAADPPGYGPIDRVSRSSVYGRRRRSQILSGTKEEDLPDGEGWAIERVHWRRTTEPISTRPGISTRPWTTGTRLTIDEVPLEWCFQPGVKLDFRHFPDGYVATAADVEAELKRSVTRCRRSKSSS